MKKILVTGAAGAIGMYVIKFLLTEGKYEITAVDLKNKTTIQRLKKFRKRINIVYGDVTDRVLMEGLVKGHDYVINLATALPPLADVKKGLSDAIDYGGCENIVRAIAYYNPKCHLFYASTTSMYKKSKNPTVKTKIELDQYDYYSESKLNAEKLIKSKIKNYTIYRLPLVLTDPVKDTFIYSCCEKGEINVITKEEAAYAFVKGIAASEELNKKTFNLATPEVIDYKVLLNKLLEINGLSFKHVASRLFIEKNYYSPVCKDTDELEKIINYQSDSLNEYFKRQKRRTNKRKVNRILAKPFVHNREVK